MTENSEGTLSLETKFQVDQPPSPKIKKERKISTIEYIMIVFFVLGILFALYSFLRTLNIAGPDPEDYSSRIVPADET